MHIRVAMSGHTQPPSSNSERSSDDASPTSPNSVLGKMILPRLSGSFYEPSLLPKRTAHACERCRALKAKCTGGQRCEKCVIDKADCRYGDGKRERNKKYMPPSSPFSPFFLYSKLISIKRDGLPSRKDKFVGRSERTAPCYN